MEVRIGGLKVCSSLENDLLPCVASVLGIRKDVMREIISSINKCWVFLSVCERHWLQSDAIYLKSKLQSKRPIYTHTQDCLLFFKLLIPQWVFPFIFWIYMSRKYRKIGRWLKWAHNWGPKVLQRQTWEIAESTALTTFLPSPRGALEKFWRDAHRSRCYSVSTVIQSVNKNRAVSY